MKASATLDRDIVRYRRALDLIVHVHDSSLHRCPDLQYIAKLARTALAGERAPETLDGE